MSSEQETIAESEHENKTENPSNSIANELQTKHPLQNEWQLWYFRPDKDKDWKDNLLDVTHFNTVEDFWALYNHIELASNLSTGSDYSVFKNGIMPMWEDVRNKSGGRWLFTFLKRDKSSAARLVDKIWLEVLLCLIGEAFGEDSDQICGAVINIRPKMDKISVWTSDSKCSPAITNIGLTLKQRTGYNQQISYEAHADTQSKTGSTARHIFNL